MNHNNFDVKQKISSLIALVFIVSISLILGWYSIKTSEEILTNMPNSRIVSMDKRVQDENFSGNTESQKAIEGSGFLNEEKTSREQ